jgi:Putative prokaryotic signal transducing protein
MADESHNDPHIMPLIAVPTEMEASIIIAALEEEGISATMSGDFTADFRVGVPGSVQVLVAKKDLAAAQRVLSAVQDDDTDVDWSQVDVGEPEPEA